MKVLWPSHITEAGSHTGTVFTSNTHDSISRWPSKGVQDRLPEPREPFVSIIMPIRNEEKAIASSLASVLAQEYPRQRMEIIVADGMSTDRTREIVLGLAKDDDRIRLVENRKQIMAAGFNEAFSVARGSIIVMLGGHTELSPNYVRACSSALQQGRAECVAGPIITLSGSGNSEAIRLCLSSRFGVGGPAFRGECNQPKYVDTVAFGAYTRDIIECVGGLDEELVRNQDDEFNYRIRKGGGRILLIPDASSRYAARSSLRLLWTQYFQYGFWKVRVLQKHLYEMQPRHFVPALFILVMLSCALLSPFFGTVKTFFVTLLLTYLTVNIVVSIATSYRAGHLKLTPILPVVFATLHFAYGIGFVLGLFHFRDRFRRSVTP
jgi:succinoglycan biosynthesis protein ExoA